MPFLLAWPDRLLHNFEEFDDLKEEVAIVRSSNTSLEKLTSLKQQQTEAKYVWMVRVVRNRSELFQTKRILEDVHRCKTVLDHHSTIWASLGSTGAFLRRN